MSQLLKVNGLDIDVSDLIRYMNANLNPTELVKWNPTRTGLVDPATGISINVAELNGLDPSHSAAVNAQALQNALNKGGTIAITTPGIYMIGDTAQSTPDASLIFGNNTTLYLGAGVVLTQATPGKSFGVNANWKSNHVAVSAIISYTQISGMLYELIVQTASAHGLAAGDSFIVKGTLNTDSPNLNDEFVVDHVPAANQIAIRLAQYNASEMSFAPITFVTQPILYKSNRNINILGQGTIDCQGYGGAGLKAMAFIFNKIARWRFTVNVHNALKYGVMFANSYHAELVDNDPMQLSASWQGLGPCKNTIFRDLVGGRSADDAWAMTTDNSGGYSSYDLTDADATVNSGGDIEGVYCYNLHPSYAGSRLINLGAANNWTVRGVRIYNATSYERGTLMLENLGAAGTTATFDDIEIDGVTAHHTSLPVVQHSQQFGANSYLGSLKIRNIKYALPRGVAYTTGDVVLLNNILSSNHISVEHVDVVNNKPTTNVGVLHINGGTHKHVVVSDVSITGDAATTGSTSALMVEGATTITAHVTNITTSGSYALVANLASTLGLNYVTVFANNLSHGANACPIVASKGCNIRTANARLTSGQGLIQAYGASQSYRITVSNVDVTVGNGVIVGLGAGSIATISGCGVEGALLDGTSGAGAVVQLKGATFNASMDGTKLDATYANHTPGAMFYNSNAAFGTGVGLYYAGATAFTKLP